MSTPVPSAPLDPEHGELPPSYDAAMDPNSAPPTYDSLYGEFQQVNSTRGLAVFISRLISIICATVAAAIILAILNVVPLAMIIIGVINYYNCPVEKWIPIWLVAFGVFSIIKSATNFYYRKKNMQKRNQGNVRTTNVNQENVVYNPFDAILNSILVVLLVLGSVWIYSVYGDVSYNPTKPGYCDQFTYVFSFVFVTIGYVLILLSIFCCCCCCCCLFMRPRRSAQPAAA
uniref:G_PROTEIN_RECEP_F1_2 domain-containing protein n=1 Tax=Steinernema glaseri TaxID=37863 RepID=A0A1I7ZKR8_9BILA